MATIGKVIVKSAVRTTIADPNFKPKPNVAISELADTTITAVQDGEVLTYDAVTGKFINSPINTALVDIQTINGGAF